VITSKKPLIRLDYRLDCPTAWFVRLPSGEEISLDEACQRGLVELIAEEWHKRTRSKYLRVSNPDVMFIWVGEGGERREFRLEELTHGKRKRLKRDYKQGGSGVSKEGRNY
jgi:hypothetical protein